MRNIALLVIFATLCSSLSMAHAQSSNNGRSIALDVRNVSSGGADGYTDVTASNGKTYSYKYSGGEGKGGDVTFHVGTPATVVVQLHSDPRYTINDVTFKDDTNSQLSYPNPDAGKTATIQDKNTVAQQAQYKVVVKDSTANATVPCDPMIINH